MLRVWASHALRSLGSSGAWNASQTCTSVLARAASNSDVEYVAQSITSCNCSSCLCEPSTSYNSSTPASWTDDVAPRAGFSVPYQLQSVRWATKKAGGTAKQTQKPVGKNHGVKMYGGELAFPGQIIIRQHGTKVHPGYNVGIGRDYTIFAKTVGFIKYTDEKVDLGGKAPVDRKFVSVVPVNGDWSSNYEEVVKQMVARRSAIKRHILRHKAIEPALYFTPPSLLNKLGHATQSKQLPPPGQAPTRSS